jgi:membrane fusion protein, heavy metal efflux system
MMRSAKKLSPDIHAEPGPREVEVGKPAANSNSGSHFPKFLRWAGLVALIAAGVLFFLDRSSKSEPVATRAPRDVPQLEGRWIRYSPAFAERAGVKFGSVTQGSLSPIVYVTGTVTYDPDKMAAVGARISGRVRSVRKLEGDVVKRGDVLAEIESAELGEAQASLISARAHLAAASANEKREKELAQAKISSFRDAELAAANAAAARAELLATEVRVRAMGGHADSEPGILLLQSPLAGKIVKRDLSRGEFVEPTKTAFKVADLSRVFVELAVFERELPSIRSGDTVDITSPSGPSALVHGKVSYVGDEIDLDTKTAPVRVIVEQPASPLRPGQSVLAKIHTRAKATQVLLLPRDAVTSVDGKSTVFVAHDETSVEPRSVVLGRQDATQVEVSEGVKEGEKVVISGVFALKSEIFR